MILTHRTDFEIAQDDYSRALDAVSGKMNKLVAGGDLQKAFGQKTTMADAMKDALDALDDINGDLIKLNALAEQRSKAFPSFKAWATDRAIVDDGRRFALIGKAADSFENFGDARDAGEFAPLSSQKPAIDPSASVTDAMLNHRFQK